MIGSNHNHILSPFPNQFFPLLYLSFLFSTIGIDLPRKCCQMRNHKHNPALLLLSLLLFLLQFFLQFRHLPAADHFRFPGKPGIFSLGIQKQNFPVRNTSHTKQQMINQTALPGLIRTGYEKTGKLLKIKDFDFSGFLIIPQWYPVTCSSIIPALAINRKELRKFRIFRNSYNPVIKRLSLLINCTLFLECQRLKLQNPLFLFA